MIEPEGARRVKLFVAALYRAETVLYAARAAMASRWGPVDFEGPDHPFDLTDYYESEMGTGLLRRLISFQRIIEPEDIVRIKHEACAIEEALAVDGRRRVNLDVGYLDVNKVVLASLKYGAMKVYLNGGVWADIVCLYRKAHFLTFDWSFADFKDGRYEHDLLAVRSRFKAALRGRGS